jgi:hypothetical protein
LSADEAPRGTRPEGSDDVQRIAVTGHVHLTADVARWVAGRLTARLGDVPGPRLHGVTCLAEGADQIFAQAVLDQGGSFEVVLPARDYAGRMARTESADTFAALLSQARSVDVMPYQRSSRAAYLAASRAMLERCDLVLAVWDGKPSRRVGDTADVVAKAREQNLPVEVVWPGLPSSPVAQVTPAAAPGPG